MRFTPRKSDPSNWFRFEVVAEETHYQALAAKRRDTPIELASPLPNTPEPMLIAYRYADVARIISDQTEFSTDSISVRYRPVLGRRTMLALSWHERRHFRSVLGATLGQRNASALRNDVVVPIIEGIIAELRNRQVFDLVTEIASVIPSRVLARLLGLPAEVAPLLLRYALAMIGFVEDPKYAIQKSRALRKLFRGLIEERHRAPSDDLVSRLLKTEDNDEGLPDEDVVDMLVLLTFAGTETALPAIASMFFALLAHPDQLDAVRSAPELARNAVEETLRWEAPVQATFRTAARDTSIAGVPVSEGTPVLAHIGSANHDVPGLLDPDLFNLLRPGPIHHLSFGLGAHRCVGAHLARLEMRLAMERIFSEWPKLRIVGGGIQITGQFVRRPASLPVEVR